MLLVKTFGLIMAVLSVEAYRNLKYPKNLIMWIPIAVGYGLLFKG